MAASCVSTFLQNNTYSLSRSQSFKLFSHIGKMSDAHHHPFSSSSPKVASSSHDLPRVLHRNPSNAKQLTLFLPCGSILGNEKSWSALFVPQATTEGKSGDVFSYGVEMTNAHDTFSQSEVAQETWSESQHSFYYAQWDSLTSKLAASATFAFLLLQLPQIILNAQNLMAGNTSALFAVPWMGQLTGLLGNLSLLSYFAKKKESGAMVVQAVGVVSTLAVLMQLAMAGSMPFSTFIVTAIVVGVGLVLNFLNYRNFLGAGIWGFWEDLITVGGLSVLPQVMWSTFQPYLPPSILPGIVASIFGSSLVTLRRLKKLPTKIEKFMGALSAWTATLLFMWAPVAQMWTNFLNPANIQGLSVFTVLLATIGNGLLLPRALFTRDAMWFTGSSWGTLLQGWGILVSMYIYNTLSDVPFWGISGALALWLRTILLQDAKAYSLPSPLTPLAELLWGKTKETHTFHS